MGKKERNERYALCVAYMNEKKEETNAMRTREKRTTT
jgi:hypothetical protein